MSETDISIPGVNGLPTNTYIVGPKYRVTFDRITIPGFTKDIPLLNEPEDPLDKLSDLEEALIRSEDPDYRIPFRTMDIRKVLTESAITDMILEEDTRFMKSIRNSLTNRESNG